MNGITRELLIGELTRNAVRVFLSGQNGGVGSAVNLTLMPRFVGDLNEEFNRYLVDNPELLPTWHLDAKTWIVIPVSSVEYIERLEHYD
jgi:hypothetical protein